MIVIVAVILVIFYASIPGTVANWLRIVCISMQSYKLLSIVLYNYCIHKNLSIRILSCIQQCVQLLCRSRCNLLQVSYADLKSLIRNHRCIKLPAVRNHELPTLVMLSISQLFYHIYVAVYLCINSAIVLLYRCVYNSIFFQSR